jgi:hypothetical protein
MNNTNFTILPFGKDNISQKQQGGIILSYSSWSYTWEKFITTYPYHKIVILQDSNGNKYFGNDTIGYEVRVELFLYDSKQDYFDNKHWWNFIEPLAILDHTNEVQKLVDYNYTKSTKNGPKTIKVYAFNIADINNTIQRCITKAIARTGIGLNVYQNDYSHIPEEKNKEISNVVDVAFESITSKAQDYNKAIEEAKIISQAIQLKPNEKSILNKKLKVFYTEEEEYHLQSMSVVHNISQD